MFSPVHNPEYTEYRHISELKCKISETLAKAVNADDQTLLRFGLNIISYTNPVVCLGFRHITVLILIVSIA